MQRIIALILIVFLNFSCSNETEFNTSSFQGTKNYQSWSAKKLHAAYTDEGGLKIIGINTGESLTLITNNITEGVYVLGNTELSSAVFEDNNFVIYSTFNNGDGEIIIDEYDSEGLTITGSFKFNSYSESGELINFNYGIFYRIPIASVANELTGSNSFNASVNSVINEVDLVETEVVNDELYIAATCSDGAYFEFFMPENIQVGSYNLNASTQIYANYVHTDGIVAQSQYGTLTILEHDQQFKKLKASFSFNTGNPYNIEVSNGNFIVYY